jgi:hypothetical protein
LDFSTISSADIGVCSVIARPSPRKDPSSQRRSRRR